MFLHCDVAFPQCHVLIDGKLEGGGGGDRDKCKHAGFILWTETRHEHFCDACLDVLSEGLRVIRVLLKQKRLQCSRMHTHTHIHTK